MENTINTVNISLSDYNALNNKLSNTQALLDQTKANLNLLTSQEKTNKIVVIEKRERDQEYGGYKLKSTVELNIKDPEVSKEILSIMDQVDNSELSETVKTQQNKIKELTTSLENHKDVLESAERSFRASTRSAEEAKEKQIRLLKKGYEDAILDLEIEKETLSKALADLKVDKTKEQMEVLRQQEIDALKDKIYSLEQFKEASNLGFFKFRKFISSFESARKFRENNLWVDKLWRNTTTALNNLESYAKMIASIGALPKKAEKNGSQGRSSQWWNGYEYITIYS